MKKIIIILIFINTLNLFSNEIVSINLYATTEDYLNKTHSYKNATAELIEKNNRYLRLGQLIDPKTGKKLKRPNRFSWMIEYEGQNYFNMGYIYDLPRWNLFVKFDIIGQRLGAIFMDREFQEVFLSTNLNSYGGGLTGVLLKEAEKWGGNWINKNNEKLRIIFVDFELIQPKFQNRNKSSIGFFLSRGHLKMLLDLDIKRKDLKEIKFEEAVKLIQELNNAS